MIDYRGTWAMAPLLMYISAAALALAVPVRGAGAQVPVSLDHNHDGVVSHKEFDDTRETHFGRIDQNGDDVLTASEFIQRPSGPSGTRPGVTRLDELRRRRFANLDTNNDGNVSHAEYMDFGRRLFAAIDADRDGRLSSDEFQRFRVGTTARRDQPVPTDRASQVFAALDGNGDGVLTLAEIETTRDRAFSRA
ncbi:MAG: EF-hand domain-containing protein, partial [Alphaproteobacteria bacterium]